MAVQMELARILIRELVDHQIIELREVGDGETNGHAPESASVFDAGETRRRFPIVIGLPEAMAIERRLKNVPINRPQTHDLLASIIRQLGGTLESISINDLSDHTFFATLNVRTSSGDLVEIDSRPSDAIALGISERVPIYVEEHVLDGALSDEM